MNVPCWFECCFFVCAKRCGCLWQFSIVRACCFVVFQQVAGNRVHENVMQSSWSNAIKTNRDSTYCFEFSYKTSWPTNWEICSQQVEQGGKESMGWLNIQWVQMDNNKTACLISLFFCSSACCTSSFKALKTESHKPYKLFGTQAWMIDTREVNN